MIACLYQQTEIFSGSINAVVAGTLANGIMHCLNYSHNIVIHIQQDLSQSQPEPELPPPPSPPLPQYISALLPPNFPTPTPPSPPPPYNVQDTLYNEYRQQQLINVLPQPLPHVDPPGMLPHDNDQLVRAQGSHSSHSSHPCHYLHVIHFTFHYLTRINHTVFCVHSMITVYCALCTVHTVYCVNNYDLAIE